MKRFCLLSFVTSIVFSTLILTSNVYADVSCNAAVIYKVGTYEGAGEGYSPYRLRMVCNDDTIWAGIKNFYMRSGVANGMYATALTALSLGQTLYVTIDDPNATIPTIINIWVNRPL